VIFREAVLAFLGIKERQEKKEKKCRHPVVCSMCRKNCSERVV